MTHKILNVLFTLALVLSFGLMTAAQTQEVHAAVTFSAEELLCRPTDHSVTVNIVANQTIQAYFEYGTTSGVYSDQTTTASYTGGTPIQVVIDGLSPNTQYYYRMVYSEDGSTWVERAEHSFRTQRAQGSTFTFTITADSHVNIMLGNATTWQNTLNNVLADHPDFHLDLGDTFAMDDVTTVAGAEAAYLFQRPYFGTISHSAPIFVMPGNHEQEEGWHLHGTLANSLPVIGTNARKKFFPNPVPDSFYSGNTDTYSYLTGDQLHEDYYAWTWGDALFVVIDPFWYTTTKPYTGNMGGGEGDTTGSGDRWDWTLGLEQFNWFKETLENSNAKYKFVFAHHMVGGSDDYVRGGANPAHICEWGGYNENGTTWGWDSRRPGWGDPIHQFMVANGVSAFFHGHDHQYAYEKRDGVVYQCLPAAGFSGSGFGIYTTGSGYTIQALNSPGHLRVTVTPTQATVDYIATTSGAVNYSYTILPNQTTNNPPVANGQSVTTNENTAKDITLSGTDVETVELTFSIVSPPSHGSLSAITNHTGTSGSPNTDTASVTYTPTSGYTGPDSFTFKVNDGTADSTTATVNVTVEATPEPGILGDVNGDDTVNSTDALIILSCDVGLDTSQFCPMNCGDVNGDGLVNSTDALIILSYDVGISVPYPVGEPGCPSSVTPCSGCSP
jgi:hypothetical protein